MTRSRSGRLSAVTLAMLAAITPAAAASISEPLKGVSITYNDGLWSAAIEDQDIDLKCKSDACGGESGECEVMLTMNNAALTSRQFFDAYQKEFTDNLVEEFDKLGVDPVVVDPPTNFMEGGVIVSISSIRYDESGTPTRAWAAAQEARFGAVTLTCYGSEDKYQTAEMAWLALLKDITIPKQ
ncbi:hypothetical protein [Mesorhizobium carmichaelinearum]|uniref:hypothetical protein n=1 Tax=Mesorhizobium carmichaelinearum TaxID=1208188 RepID=UPI00117FD924|nr:hypothetical protein [Mesorhizobium carmichaelinearum]